MDFSDASAVRKLAAAGEQLVRLDFPEGLGSLYCHKFLLSFTSPVLRNVLEDVKQEQGEQCSIPVAGADSDVSVWKLVLSLVYRFESATITLDNAKALLLLAHKYDMRSITAEVEKFLLGNDPPAACSRLWSHLSPSTLSSCLTTFSKCGRDKLIQLCIDYIINKQPPVDTIQEVLTSLPPSHAGQVLKAMQQEIIDTRSKLGTANSKVDKAVHHLGGSNTTAHTCSICNASWISQSSGASFGDVYCRCGKKSRKSVPMFF